VTSDRLAELLAPWLDAGPAYLGLAAGLRGLALDGRLPVGTRIASERQLALVLGVSRNTITAAYDVLRSEGYLASARGGGSRVTLPAAVPARPDAVPGERPDIWDLSVAALPAPAALIDSVTEAALALHPLLAGHGLYPLGLPETREAVADHLTRRGLSTRADQVLITNGSLHGWDLLLRALTRPGVRVLVEQPTYPAVLDAVMSHRLRPVAFPVTGQGWEMPAPATALAHLIPDGQNPTGFLATTAQRRNLLRQLRAEVIACDETFADLVLDGSPPVPLGALDERVVTLGSMSKAFWAGLRVGWVRADRDTLTRLAQIRAGTDLAGPVLEQLIAARLLRRADAVLAERRALLRRSRDALMDALTLALPTWRFHRPAAGMVLWIEMPEARATRLVAHALDIGLRLTAGPRFTIDGTADRWFRLPYTLPPEKVAAVVDLLVDAAGRVDSGAPPSGNKQSRWTA
jgi:DNA-binding transcriptional MocR family regulator